MLKGLNQVMDYIEAHLTDDLSPEVISEYAGVSIITFERYSIILPG